MESEKKDENKNEEEKNDENKNDAVMDDNQEQMIKDADNVESVSELIDNQFKKYLEEKKEALSDPVERMIADFRQLTSKWKEAQYQKLRQSEGSDAQEQLKQMQKQWNEMTTDFEKIVTDTTEAIKEKQQQQAEMMKQFLKDSNETQ